MASAFSPPPTYAEVILFDKEGKNPKFNPIWLKWFVDVAALLTASGGGGGGLDHNLLSSLQGGTANQYYHLSSGNYTALTAGFTGTGSLVRATSPTLVTPVLGTPTSGDLANCIGLPTSGITGGISVTITTAKLTGAGANGSMTFTNGVLTAQTAAT